MSSKPSFRLSSQVGGKGPWEQQRVEPGSLTCGSAMGKAEQVGAPGGLRAPTPALGGPNACGRERPGARIQSSLGLRWRAMGGRERHANVTVREPGMSSPRRRSFLRITAPNSLPRPPNIIYDIITTLTAPGLPHYPKVCFLPPRLYHRLTSVPVFAHQKALEDFTSVKWCFFV